jgi:lipoprotein-anchoring transpeptidase ErfK/SrfK
MYKKLESWILILPRMQRLYCFEEGGLRFVYPVSTAKNGLGELNGSGCTPRGWHQIHSIIGEDCPLYSVFVGRKWTKEIYSTNLGTQFPERDWILSRILRLEGLEPGRNKGAEVDTFARYIYIHGTPEPMKKNLPLSHGCIRMCNKDVLNLAGWIKTGVRVYIHDC